MTEVTAPGPTRDQNPSLETPGMLKLCIWVASSSGGLGVTLGGHPVYYLESPAVTSIGTEWVTMAGKGELISTWD